MPYWRLSAVYFSYFAVVGATVPFWSLYLQSLGLTAHSIGILAAIPMLTKLVSPNVWGWLSDYSGNRLGVARLGAFIGSCCFVGVVFQKDYLGLAFFIALYSFFWNAILPQFEVITLDYIRDTPHFYSRIRLWGSVGFIAVVIGLGYAFDYISIGFLPWLILVFLVIIFISACALPSQKARPKSSTRHAFLQTICKPSVLLFLIICFLLQFSHGVYYTFFSIYLESYSYPRALIGALWALGVAAEIYIFIKMPYLFQRWNLYQLLLCSLFLTALRWLIIAWCVENTLLIFFAQLLHAFSFGVAHAVAVEFIRRNIHGDCQSQGQALYSAVSFGGGAALGAYFSGVMWSYSAAWAFTGAAAVAALAGCFSIILLRNK